MRKRRAVKRDILPDPIYKSKIVAKLINTIMLDGKKGIAQTIVYEAFDTVKNKTGKECPIRAIVISAITFLCTSIVLCIKNKNILI